jgi:negative regulator of sigma-B (phosphoserine phosphatase)
MDLSVDELLDYSSANRPCLGEQVSGDCVVTRALENGLFVAIIDVLGHGQNAHELTHVIDAFLVRYGAFGVASVMSNLHQHLRGTLGAAAGLCAIDTTSGRLDYVGIGNTSIRRFGCMETRLVSQDGVLGQNMRTPKLQSLQLEPGDMLLLYTDGISDRFTSGDYPAMLHHSPQQAAKNIVQRFGKDHDDATCFALRYGA